MCGACHQREATSSALYLKFGVLVVILNEADQKRWNPVSAQSALERKNKWDKLKQFGCYFIWSWAFSVFTVLKERLLKRLRLVDCERSSHNIYCVKENVAPSYAVKLAVKLAGSRGESNNASSVNDPQLYPKAPCGVPVCASQRASVIDRSVPFVLSHTGQVCG
eukprot:3899673-Amphidinium_carterae.2